MVKGHLNYFKCITKMVGLYKYEERLNKEDMNTTGICLYY